jgi:hypothetical protein
MLTVIDKVDALLTGITKAEIEAMSPDLRRRLALALRRVADLADPPPGIRQELGDGKRSD